MRKTLNKEYSHAKLTLVPQGDQTKAKEDKPLRQPFKKVSQKTTCIVASLLILALNAAMLTPAFADDENVVNIQQAPDSSFIYDTSITDLNTADTYYENQTVQVVGEVVGDNIFADREGNYRWISLASLSASSDATIAVYMSREDAAKIDTFGRHGTTGTSLQVRGTFHLVCPEHEGDTDLHAEIITVVEKGKVTSEQFDIKTFGPGIGAVIGGLALLAIFYEVRKRRL